MVHPWRHPWGRECPYGWRRAVHFSTAECQSVNPPAWSNLPPPITDREILVSFARGMSYAGIAAEPGIKRVTVRNAVYGIRDKLEAGSMQGLVLWAVRNGLLDDHGADG